MNLFEARARNIGTCRFDAKGEVNIGEPEEHKSTDARHRGGDSRSSDEKFVMSLERRGIVTQRNKLVNRIGRNQ